MKKGWTKKPLADLCDVFADGDWVESKDQSSAGIRLIQTGNVGEGIFKDRAEKARYISEGTFKRLRCTEIFRGDCLISRLPEPVGRSCLLPDTGERMITAVDCTIVRFNREACLPAFFNLYSQSDEYLATVAKACTGTTRSRISRSNLGLTPIPVPPLPEQRRIVRLLDEAFAGLATAQSNAEKNLQNARALFESHLNAVFSQQGKGWTKRRLQDLCTFSSGGTPSKQNGSYWKGNIPWVSGRDMKSTRLSDAALHISQKAVDESSTRMAPAGSLLTLVRGMGLAHGAQVAELMVPCAFNQDIRAIHPNRDMVPRYLLFALKTLINTSDNVMSNAAHGTMKIDMDELKNVEIPVCSLEDQGRIAGQIDSISQQAQRLESIYVRKLASLDELKKSLLHQAFNGEL